MALLTNGVQGVSDLMRLDDEFGRGVLTSEVPGGLDRWSAADAVKTVLADGTSIVVLPVGPDAHDHELLRDELLMHFPELSAESRHRRFLYTVPELTPSMLHRLVDTVDNLDHVALVAQVVAPGTDLAPMLGSLVGVPVGLARFIRDPRRPAVAEAAVTVVDAWQHRGIGSLLIKSLAQAALRRGVTTFAADVLATNASSLALLRHAGAVTHDPIAQGIVRFEVALKPGAEAAPSDPSTARETPT